MQYLSYRNLGEPGGPEFTEEEVKAIAAGFEVTDGPNAQGEMFTRPGRPSDKFVSPYPNVNAAAAANGGAYPPDMSVLVKARKRGANYIYSVLVGYEDPPVGVILDEGVYYNKYMIGNKIKMPNNLSNGLVEYADGTEATVDQMAKDVTTFLSWAAEPELESRHKTGVKVMLYLILLSILVFLSMKRIWSRVNLKYKNITVFYNIIFSLNSKFSIFFTFFCASKFYKIVSINSFCSYEFFQNLYELLQQQQEQEYFFTVHALLSSFPEVKNVSKPSKL